MRKSASKILIAGLPSSGTTWLAEVVSAAPRVRYSREPDNPYREPLATASRERGAAPLLSAGDRADDYRLVWEFAFAGGWSARGPRAARTIRRLAGVAEVSPRARLGLYARAARIAARFPRGRAHHVVKSVYACHALEWIQHEFEPTMVVAWRHPLNLVSSWRDRGWNGFDYVAAAKGALTDRFKDTPVWPSRPRDAFGSLIWIICAESALLLETVRKHPEWILVGHESLCVDPRTEFHALADRLSLEWNESLDRRLDRSNRPGDGFQTRRVWTEQPHRWKRRLSPDEQDQIHACIEGFAAVSPAAAAAWRTSGAVVDARV